MSHIIPPEAWLNYFGHAEAGAVVLCLWASTHDLCIPSDCVEGSYLVHVDCQLVRVVSR
jgi:hypothetical protein